MNVERRAEWWDVYFPNAPEVETSFYVDLTRGVGDAVLEAYAGAGGQAYLR